MLGRGKGDKEAGHRGRHRAIDPDETFTHPDVTGETRPNKIREMIREAEKTNQAETDRIIRERRSE